MIGRRISAVIATGALALGGAALTASNANAVGVNMDQACQLTNGAGWVAQLTYPGDGAYGWRCWVPPFGVVKKGVNVQLYCSAVWGLNASTPAAPTAGTAPEPAVTG